jgi:hypothetical protein
MPPFMKGMQLSEHLYNEAIAPILAARFPELPYSAARLDYGSDVLGFDAPRSMDHGWGPRCTLFLRAADHARLAASIVETLARELPVEVHGFPTHYDTPALSQHVMTPIERGPVRHAVTVTTVVECFKGYLGCNPSQPLGTLDWLTIPPQRLRTVAAGRVFHDGLGELAPIRARLAWYPRDVWLYLLASQWQRIDQEEPFMARCGDAGDELGSRLIAARMIEELMRVCFLMERHYAPYSKWFGSAFAQLGCAPILTPIFERALNGTAWREREQHLSAAYVAVGELHNALGLTDPIEPRVAPFFDRPYLVPHAARYAAALRAIIASPEMRALPPVGAVSQFVDSTDVLDSLERCRAVAGIYQPA